MTTPHGRFVGSISGRTRSARPRNSHFATSAGRTQSVRRPIALPRVAAFNQTGIGAVVQSVELRPAQSNGS
jgi:hypothetical protein